jgi:hypothetical protein
LKIEEFQAVFEAFLFRFVYRIERAFNTQRPAAGNLGISDGGRNALMPEQVPAD